MRTEWRLVELGARPVPATGDSTRHPGFTLVAEGAYELEGTKLKFGPLATTRMACPAMETETAFLKALEGTVRYEVSGASLTLYGADGQLARLEATATPS